MQQTGPPASYYKRRRTDKESEILPNTFRQLTSGETLVWARRVCDIGDSGVVTPFQYKRGHYYPSQSSAMIVRPQPTSGARTIQRNPGCVTLGDLDTVNKAIGILKNSLTHPALNPQPHIGITIIDAYILNFLAKLYSIRRDYVRAYHSLLQCWHYLRENPKKDDLIELPAMRLRKYQLIAAGPVYRGNNMRSIYNALLSRTFTTSRYAHSYIDEMLNTCKKEPRMLLILRFIRILIMMDPHFKIVITKQDCWTKGGMGTCNAYNTIKVRMNKEGHFASKDLFHELVHALAWRLFFVTGMAPYTPENMNEGRPLLRDALEAIKQHDDCEFVRERMDLHESYKTSEERLDGELFARGMEIWYSFLRLKIPVRGGALFAKFFDRHVRSRLDRAVKMQESRLGIPVESQKYEYERH